MRSLIIFIVTTTLLISCISSEKNKKKTVESIKEVVAGTLAYEPEEIKAELLRSWRAYKEHA